MLWSRRGSGLQTDAKNNVMRLQPAPAVERLPISLTRQTLDCPCDLYESQAHNLAICELATAIRVESEKVTSN